MKNCLPIGSVVLLKEAEKALMIYGRKQTHVDTGEVLDYVACFYPEGHISDQYTFLFNHEDIAEVLFTGFIDEEEEVFLKAIEMMEIEDTIHDEEDKE